MLNSLRPFLAVEIRTYHGGSLHFLSRFSEAVISVDIDPEVEERLSGKFSNLEFRSGDSRPVLVFVLRDCFTPDCREGMLTAK